MEMALQDQKELEDLFNLENLGDALKAKGFYRVRVRNPDGEVAGDSGWQKNQITNLGIRDYLLRPMAALAGSSQVGYVGLGTGGAPAAADTTLAGEVEERTAVTAVTSSNSFAIQFTATFSSAGSFVTDTQNISNIGLFATDASGTLMAGNTYASSSCATNQDVNITYVISLSTS